MSHEGKLKRGARYWGHRDREDKLPTWITNSKSRMEDVKYFLEDSKPTTVSKEPKPKKEK